MFFKASVFQSHHDRRQITPAKLLISFNANTGFALYSGDILDCTSYNRSSDNTTLSFNCYALPTTVVTDYTATQ